MTLGVFHQVYTRPKATEEAIKSFRQFHPDNPYVLICDGGKSFHRIAKKYNCLYVHQEDNLGYRDHTHESGIYGMTKVEVLEWLRRFRLACTLCNTDHILMMEDDILIRNEIHVPEDWEFAGQAKPGNLLQSQTLVQVDPRYFRPAEVDLLVGDATKAKRVLGWAPKHTLEELCAERVASDLAVFERTKYLRDGGHEVVTPQAGCGLTQ